MYCRVTAYNTRSKINHKGKKLVNGGVAVPSNTLKDGTLLYFPKIDKWLKVDDRMSRQSVTKHNRLAKKRGKKINLVLDIRWDIPTKQLMSKDLGYCVVYVYK